MHCNVDLGSEREMKITDIRHLGRNQRSELLCHFQMPLKLHLTRKCIQLLLCIA